MNGALDEKKDTRFSTENQPANEIKGPAVANSNKRRKLITDALNLALNERPEPDTDNDGNPIEGSLDEDGKPKKNLRILADRMVKDALTGDNIITKEVLDRTEGKAPQSLIVGGDPENPVVNQFTFVPVGPANESNND